MGKFGTAQTLHFGEDLQAADRVASSFRARRRFTVARIIEIGYGRWAVRFAQPHAMSSEPTLARVWGVR